MRRALVTAVAAAAFVIPGIVAVAAEAPAPIAAQAQTGSGPNTWMVDTGHSNAGFSVKHMMISTVRGTLGPIKGTIDYDGKSLDSIKVDVSIDVSAINTGNESRDRDLKGEGFFDVARFPAATFKSKRVEAAGAGKFKLTGDLTMHGITKEVVLDVEGPSPAVKTQNGGQKVGASATTILNRRDFDLQYNNLIEAGPVLADEIHVTIDIEASKRG
ncbi:MAG TPA: YceI family protein [Vicinamibacterales bacterium]|nr:YceI family protein [Vicinamibacterales bacterium]